MTFECAECGVKCTHAWMVKDCERENCPADKAMIRATSKTISVMTLTPEEREAVERMLEISPAPWKLAGEYTLDADGRYIMAFMRNMVSLQDGLFACVNAVARSLVK